MGAGCRVQGVQGCMLCAPACPQPLTQDASKGRLRGAGGQPGLYRSVLLPYIRPQHRLVQPHQGAGHGDVGQRRGRAGLQVRRSCRGQGLGWDGLQGGGDPSPSPAQTPARGARQRRRTRRGLAARWACSVVSAPVSRACAAARSSAERAWQVGSTQAPAAASTSAASASQRSSSPASAAGQSCSAALPEEATAGGGREAGRAAVSALCTPPPPITAPSPHRRLAGRGVRTVARDGNAGLDGLAVSRREDGLLRPGSRRRRQ